MTPEQVAALMMLYADLRLNISQREAVIAELQAKIAELEADLPATATTPDLVA